MSRWADERAVTVQIGAVLLLAIVFSALALYQVNAVPAENQAIESEHNQQVHDELQELRNAIRNVGTSGGSESVSVTLGTSYPTRTFLTNPTDPRGTLRTSETGTVRIDNAAVDDTDGSYTGNPDGLLGTAHETRTVQYEPSYNEYRTAPTTRLEHGFAFNDFSDATVALTEQPLIDGDRITIVLVEGNLSTSSSGATTVDTRVLSGPTDPIDLEPDGDNITITVPTASPTAWNETIGTELGSGSGQAKAKVTDYSGGALTIELAADSDYELQMARVGVGDASASESDPFDVQDASSDSTSGPAYTVNWQDPSSEPGADGDNCDSESCVVTDDTTLTMETSGTAAGASVDYAVSDRTVGTLSRYTGTTANDGTDTTRFEIDPNADNGERVTVYTSSGTDDDSIELEVNREPFFDVSVTGTNEPVVEENDLEVTATVDNTGGESGDQTVEFELEDESGATVFTDTASVQLDSGESDTRTFQWGTASGDAGEYTAVVTSENDTATRDGLRVVTEIADIDITDVTGLEDGTDADAYEADITVEETNTVETENLSVDLVIRNADNDVVYDETISSAEISDETTTVSFGDIGTLEAGEYTYTATADADNANAVQFEDSFSVTEVVGPTIDQFDAETRSGSGNTGIRVSWEASAGDAPLETVELRVEDDSGVVDTRTYDVSGDQTARENNVDFEGLNGGEQYDVVLTVTDQNDKTVSQTEQQTAG
ncbi:CARDB domain-containing protein [Natrinema salsiterrestre]|uniref:CARDB domain-containing protein n=1 Tax=Natrinema salsiterrestre TaxID=2950540 RepID=A0A9Q4L6M7_9EURY|nr:CARDB domain-containing protein [Natrinema salsiterrestre]MDF9746246.1 hypothetical protein [Natrinema salsiterrestre]